LRLRSLTLADFRCYESAEVELGDGATVVVGANGQGKTSLLEAAGWIATGASFRGVPDAALVRSGAERAVIRALVERGGGQQRVEVELAATGRSRVLVNHHPLARRRDLAEGLRVTVFSPDDLELVKGAPATRRRYLDDLLAASSPRYDAARTDADRVLRQRNALLRGGRLDTEARATLDVFDRQLSRAAGELVRGRLRLVERLLPEIRAAYASLAGEPTELDATYEAEWADGPLGAGSDLEGMLQGALERRRPQEIERRTTLVGPHRDEWHLAVRGLGARSSASQGEQRCLALALRLGGHRVVADVVGENPVLLLDDVFSELDPARASALVRHLPEGQTLLTTAGAVPEGIRVERLLRVSRGVLERAA